MIDRKYLTLQELKLQGLSVADEQKVADEHKMSHKPISLLEGMCDATECNNARRGMTLSTARIDYWNIDGVDSSSIGTVEFTLELLGTEGKNYGRTIQDPKALKYCPLEGEPRTLTSSNCTPSQNFPYRRLNLGDTISGFEHDDGHNPKSK
ncbi:hypothetical protein HYX14_00570 [Candidatus Woesearchaeota archaeon]|nr:hypothetical protein [Candidatus Woesearchaeota archaeon]